MYVSILTHPLYSFVVKRADEVQHPCLGSKGEHPSYVTSSDLVSNTRRCELSSININ